MRYYETLYIVNPNFEENRLQDIIGDITKEIGRFNFSVINHRVWGKKRLAFSVSKHNILKKFGRMKKKFLIRL
jgi:ribosomal protein S6